MKTSFLAGLLLALSVIPAFAGAAEPFLATNAMIDAELRNREIAASLAPIKSREDLQRYMAATLADLNPMSRLSPAGKQRFLDSLVFNDEGALAGFRYGDLEAELSVSEIYRIMSLFGAQHTVGLMAKARVVSKEDRQIRSAPGMSLMADHAGYACVSRANCYQSPGFICMSGC